MESINTETPNHRYTDMSTIQERVEKNLEIRNEALQLFDDYPIPGKKPEIYLFRETTGNFSVEPSDYECYFDGCHEQASETTLVSSFGQISPIFTCGCCHQKYHGKKLRDFPKGRFMVFKEQLQEAV